MKRLLEELVLAGETGTTVSLDGRQAKLLGDLIRELALSELLGEMRNHKIRGLIRQLELE